MKFVGVLVLGFCALIATATGVARATGAPGDSIATALVATPGVQQDGSTSSHSDSCSNGFEFWKLQLEKGDLVQISWGDTATVDKLALWPADTTDSDKTSSCVYEPSWTGWDVSPVLVASNPSPGALVSQAFVDKDGTYPLLFVSTTPANAGAYSFTAVVRHAAIVGLPHVSSIDGAGTLTASVLAPDSDPINDANLTLTLNGYWSSRAGKPAQPHVLATATPTNGSASFDYNLPPDLWGKKIRLAISGGGASYQDVTTPQEPVKVLVTTGAAVVASRSALKAASRLLRQPIYWAGRRKGFHYEFTRTTKGYVFVRYLSHGVKVGDPRPKFLIVATYPYRGAYAALKKYAHGHAVAGPHRSIYFVEPGAPTNVYVAFPKVNYEMEIFDPSPALARKIASAGLIRPVR